MTVLALDPPRNPTCPIWEGLQRDTINYGRSVVDGGSRFYSSRAGGPFLLMQTGADLLDEPYEKSLTDRQKANLSHWIYKHNLENRLFDELPNQDLQMPGWFAHWMNDHRERVLELDRVWVEGQRDRTPAAADRMLMFLRELIRSNDAGEHPDEDFLKAAGGCRDQNDLLELQRHAVEQGWTGNRDPQGSDTSPLRINYSALVHVDEQLRDRGGDQPSAA